MTFLTQKGNTMYVIIVANILKPLTYKNIDMKRIPTEIKRKIMSYLRLCDVCGKTADSNICGYCDFNCYYTVKQEQLKCVAAGSVLVLIIYKINTFCCVMFTLYVLVLIETLF